MDKKENTEYNENRRRNKKGRMKHMLKNYPATQLFLLSSLILMILLLITPLVREWYIFAAVLGSLKFVVKVYSSVSN